ncbi:glycosyltransferase [Vibrio vulnificus]
MCISPPIISVITVNFNQAEDLLKTIASVRAQKSHSEVNFIVIDGGSNDSSLDVISDNLDVIDYWVSEKDKGIYDAMNKGVYAASGEYLIFMNGGDVFADELTCRHVLDAVDTNKMPSVIYGNYVQVRGNNEKIMRFAKDHNTLERCMFTCHQAIFFHRKCFSERCYSLDYPIAGDYEFCLYLYLNSHTFSKMQHFICEFDSGGVSDISRVESIFEVISILKRSNRLSVVNRIYLYYRIFRESLVSQIKRITK